MTAEQTTTAEVAPFPERHSPRWWVLSQLNAAHAWHSAPTTAQLRTALCSHLHMPELDLAIADLIHEGRIRPVAVDQGDGQGWSFTEAGLAEWREQQ